MRDKAPEGFTLVEMMIAVGIIGLLAAIAVPSYRRHQWKMRQTEVKSELSQAYLAEMNYRADTSTFTACLGSIGVTSPSERNQVEFYSFGIGLTAGNCGPNAAGFCGTYIWDRSGSALTTCPSTFNYIAFAANAVSVKGDSIPNILATGPASQISSSVFTVPAIGKISTLGALDEWTIDQTQQLINVLPGL